MGVSNAKAEWGTGDINALASVYEANLNPGLITPLGSHPAVLVANSTVQTASTARGLRMVAPADGTITGVAFFLAVSSGNIDVAILDTSATTRNVLYSSGSIACPGGANVWVDLGINPGIAVVAGQQFDLGITFDNATISLGRISAVASGANQLPTGYMLPGTTAGSPKQLLSWSASITVGAWGATLLESAMSMQAPLYAFICKMSLS